MDRKSRLPHNDQEGRIDVRQEASRFGSFLLIGGSATVLNLSIVGGLTLIARWSYLPAALIAMEAGVFFSFLLNDRLTFRALANDAGGWIARCIRFHGASAAGQALTLAISLALIHFIGLLALVAQAISVAVVTIFNFVVLRFWAYKFRGRTRTDTAGPTILSEHTGEALWSPLAWANQWNHVEVGSRGLQVGGGGTMQPPIWDQNTAKRVAIPGDAHESASYPLWEVETAKMAGVAWDGITRQVEDVSPPADETNVQISALPEHGPSLLRQIPYMLVAMRPKQWTKNGLVLLALIFAHKLFDPIAIYHVLLAFAAFSLTSSMVYVFNDIGDREKDRLHPKKRFRPIASRRLSIPLAVITAVFCGLGASYLCYRLVADQSRSLNGLMSTRGISSLLFVATLFGYIVINIAYTNYLKHRVLWDVFVIAAGFVLRAIAGALAVPVPISPWFYLTTLFLALFLALGKRRAELVLLSHNAADHRKNLREYNVVLLDQLMVIAVTCTLMTYSLYTFVGDVAGRRLMTTIPIVIFGVFRYMYLVYVKSAGDRPDEILWQDAQILGAVLLYIGVAVAVLYGIPLLHGLNMPVLP